MCQVKQSRTVITKQYYNNFTKVIIIFYKNKGYNYIIKIKLVNMNEKIPCVYMLTNKKAGTVYVGVTSNLQKRIWEHKNNMVQGFTKKYNLHNLVYYEVCPSMKSAIEREKQLKGGSRKKKITLIEKDNLLWNDLYDEIIKNG